MWQEHWLPIECAFATRVAWKCESGCSKIGPAWAFLAGELVGVCSSAAIVAFLFSSYAVAKIEK
jgi:hypothetical protein